MQQLENENIKYQDMIRFAKQDLQEHKQKLYEVSEQLHSATQDLSRSEKQSKNQWTAVLSLASLLPSQFNNHGEALDVASLFREKEALRQGLELTEFDLANSRNRITAAETELRTSQNTWEEELELWRMRNADLTKRLQSSNKLAQELGTSSNQLRDTLRLKEQEIERLCRQMSNTQTRVLVGPVPPRKNGSNNVN